MSFGSFEPPPVKDVSLRPDSAVHATAVAPLVFSVVEHLVPGPFGSVTSWQTLSQSSLAFGPKGWVAVEASPSSWNVPVSWTARALETRNARNAMVARRTARRRLPAAGSREVSEGGGVSKESVIGQQSQQETRLASAYRRFV